MFKKFEDEYLRITAAFLLIGIGVLGRVFLVNILPDSPSFIFTFNGVTQPLFMIDLFFIVAVVAILSGLILGGIYTFIVPLSVMAITDIILGNNYIFLFTWSGFALMALIGYLLKTKNSFKIKKTPSIIGFSLIGVLFFDIWTNFGCWLGWYPHNIEGLSLCFTVALPFMFWHLLSTAVLLTVIILPLTYLNEKELINFNYSINPFEKHVTTLFISVLIFLAIFSVTF
jgi:hypothetical protein